jgi:hypothetical protein
MTEDLDQMRAASAAGRQQAEMSQIAEGALAATSMAAIRSSQKLLLEPISARCYRASPKHPRSRPRPTRNEPRRSERASDKGTRRSERGSVG